MGVGAEEMLRALVPLKVVLLTEAPTAEHPAIRTAMTRGFQGGSISSDSAEAYFAAGENLGVTVLDAVFAKDEADAKKDGAAAKRIVEDARRDALHTMI